MYVLPWENYTLWEIENLIHDEMGIEIKTKPCFYLFQMKFKRGINMGVTERYRAYSCPN